MLIEGIENIYYKVDGAETVINSTVEAPQTAAL